MGFLVALFIYPLWFLVIILLVCALVIREKMKSKREARELQELISGNRLPAPPTAPVRIQSRPEPPKVPARIQSLPAPQQDLYMRRWSIQRKRWTETEKAQWQEQFEALQPVQPQPAAPSDVYAELRSRLDNLNDVELAVPDVSAEDAFAQLRSRLEDLQ